MLCPPAGTVVFRARMRSKAKGFVLHFRFCLCALRAGKVCTCVCVLYVSCVVADPESAHTTFDKQVLTLQRQTQWRKTLCMADLKYN